MLTRSCASRRARCLAFKPEETIGADGGEDFAVRRYVDRVVAGRVDDTEDGPGFAVKFLKPARGAVGLVEGLGADPECSVGYGQREGFAVAFKLVEEFAGLGEALDATIFAVGDVDDAVRVDGDAVGEIELTRGVGGEGDVGGAVEGGLRFGLLADVDGQ
jgi:hypothetical protein